MLSVRESAVVAVIVALPLGQPEPFTLSTLAENPTSATGGCVGFAAVLDTAGATLAPVLVLETEGVGLTPVPEPSEGIPCAPAADSGGCLDCSEYSPEQPQTHAALSSG